MSAVVSFTTAAKNQLVGLHSIRVYLQRILWTYVMINNLTRTDALTEKHWGNCLENFNKIPRLNPLLIPSFVPRPGDAGDTQSSRCFLPNILQVPFSGIFESKSLQIRSLPSLPACPAPDPCSQPNTLCTALNTAKTRLAKLAPASSASFPGPSLIVQYSSSELEEGRVWRLLFHIWCSSKTCYFWGISIYCLIGPGQMESKPACKQVR